MRFHSPDCIALLRRLCDEHDLLLVLDEIATGFGRTGALFACEHANVTPDVMCLGKALTGGYLTLAATLCSKRVAHAIGEGRGRRADARADVHGQSPRLRRRARVAGVAHGVPAAMAPDEWRGRLARACRRDRARAARWA